LDSVRIDRIEMKRNWMTWDMIIRREMDFRPGDRVSFGQIDTTIQKIWNIGNFANVAYTLTEVDGDTVMTIKALDAVKFFPLIGVDHSSKDDYSYQLGFVDSNFLGSNSNMSFSWVRQPLGTSWNFSLRLPRQLLYKNMTLGFGFSSGHTVQRYLEREFIYDTGGKVESVEYVPLMLAPHDKLEFRTSIGNPWHLDYRYRFSPDLGISYQKYDFNSELLELGEEDGDVLLDPFHHQFLSVWVSESVGLINHRRRRKDGYQLGASYGVGIGLTPETPTHYSLGFSAQYHKIFTRLFQLSSWYRTGYTSAGDPYKFAGGSGNVLGLRSGEIHGSVYYSAYLGGHFTWLDRPWLTVENAYFFNWGQGEDRYWQLFTERPFMAVGSSVVVQVPTAPFLVINFTFMYAGPGTEWFKIKF
jgi:outer membrane protein assembly factor BamA